MKILDMIADGVGGAIDTTTDLVTDPIGVLQGAYDDSVLKALMQDPENFNRYLLELAKEGKSIGTGMRPVSSSYQPVPLLPTGGFMRDMPNFMNTDQLVLSGGY